MADRTNPALGTPLDVRAAFDRLDSNLLERVASRVEISRNKQGDVVIHPVPADRGRALLEAPSGLGDEFVALLEEDRRGQLPMQDRVSL